MEGWVLVVQVLDNNGSIAGAASCTIDSGASAFVQGFTELVAGKLQGLYKHNFGVGESGLNGVTNDKGDELILVCIRSAE